MTSATPPSATTTHASERYRLVRLAIAAGSAERVVSSVASAVRVSLLVWALGAHGYGLYVATLGLVGTAGLLDFGLHYGIVNAVAKARGRDDRSLIRTIVATGAAVYTAISLVATLVVALGIAVAPVTWMFQATADEASTVRLIAVLGFGGLLLNMPLKVIPAGLVGFQEQHVAAAFRSVSNIVNISVTAAAAVLARGRLVPLVAAGVVSDLVLGAIFFLWVSIRLRPELRIRFRAATKPMARLLLASGLVFFVTNLANVFKRSLATTLIAHYLGPSTVPTFSIPLTLVTIGIGFAELFAGSFWPAFGEAAARADWPWINKAFALATKMALTAGALAALLCFTTGDELILVWTGGKIVPPSQALMGWLCLWMMAMVSATASVTLLNGLDRPRLVMAATLVEGLVVFCASALALRERGLTAMGATMACATVANTVFLGSYGVKRASGGRVRPALGSHARVAAATVAAGSLGLAADRLLAGTWAVLHLFAGAAATGGCFVVIAWFGVLDADERVRLVAWARRRRAI